MTRKMTMIKKTLLVVMMVTFGINVSWGQGTPVDYSGTYYIRSESPNKNTDGDYYMCPTKGWYLYTGTNSYENDTDDDDDNGKPFLTTYQCKTNSYDDVSKAVWTIKKDTDTGCYYIIQKKTGRYLVSNGQISGSTSARRMRVHLEEVADETALTNLGDMALFEIVYHAKDKNTTVNHLDIIPHSSSGWYNSEKRLVVNFKNFNLLKASTDKPDGPDGTYGKGTGGIIGVYSNEANEQWALEIPNPSFYLNINEDELSVVGDLAFYYTTNGADPEVTGDGTPGTSTTKYDGPISLDGVNLIKYIVTSKDGKTIKSSVITYYKNSSVVLEETGLVYNGTAQVPTVSSITINEESKTVSDFTIGGKNNVDAGTAILTLWDETNGIYTTNEFTINPAEVTVKADDKTKVYQETPSADPTLTATITGLVNNEPESKITYTISREEGEAAGLYTITPTGDAVQGNYHVNYETGVFQIGKEITPAPTISLTNWTYGSPNEPSVLGNAGGGEVTYYYKVKDAEDDTYTEEVPRNVGDYTVKAEIARTSEYFGVTTGAVDFKINKAPLTIVADAITKDYLDEDPELTYTVSGIQYNEDGSSVLTCELQRAAGEAKGQYAITKKSHNLISGNYNAPSFTGAMFTIIAKNLGDPVTLEPTSGISIYAKDNGNDSWTVSVYTGKTAFIEGTDYNSVVTGPDDNGNYTITVTAVEPSNCRGTAQATYSPATFYNISGTTEKFIPYISTTSDLTTSSDLVPYIVTQVNPSIGTVSIVPISYVPKDEPVLLLAASDVTGITTSPKNPATSPISESLISINKLNIAPDEPSDPDNPESVHGVHVEATEAYMFYIGEFVLTTEGTIKPGRYYLYNPMYRASADPGTPSPALARSLAIVKNETTGIILLTNDEVKEDFNDVWYSIDGQKINKKPTRKGIYIQKGKKLILK